MATIKEIFPSDSLLWLEFGGQYINSAGNRVIDNLAERADAPKTVTCGPGAACPTQASGKRGVVFAGAQWIDCGLIDRFERTDAFTLVAAVSNMANPSGRIITSWDTSNDYRGICFGNAPNVSPVYIANAMASRIYLYHFPYATAASAGSFNIRAMTYAGNSLVSGVSVFHNGVQKACVIGSDTLNATIKSGNPFMLGGQTTGGVKSGQFTGTMNFAAIFPLAASPLQIQNLTKRVMRRINLP